MLQSLHWRRLDQRRIDSRLSLCYKITNSLVAIPLEDYMTLTNRRSRHSHGLAFKLIDSSTDFYKFSFFPRTVYHWNALPHDVPVLPTIEEFNSAIKYCFIKFVAIRNRYTIYNVKHIFMHNCSSKFLKIKS